MKSYSVAIQTRAPQQYFPTVLFIMLYNVIQTFDSVIEIVVLFYGTFYTVQDGSNF